MVGGAGGGNGGALSPEGKVPALAITAPSTWSSRHGAANGGAGAAGAAGAVAANVVGFPPNKLIAAAAPGVAGPNASIAWVVPSSAPAGKTQASHPLEEATSSGDSHLYAP